MTHSTINSVAISAGRSSRMPVRGPRTGEVIFDPFGPLFSDPMATTHSQPPVTDALSRGVALDPFRVPERTRDRDDTAHGTSG